MTLYRALRITAIVLLITVIAGASFFAGMFFGKPNGLAMLPITGSFQSGTSNQSQTLNTDLIKQAYQLIQQNYADRQTLQDTNMTYSAISGMVNSLGDTGHSRFLTPQEVVSENRSLSGEFEGIGALLQMKDGKPIILAPMDNSPALKAGLRPGDEIIGVNGEDMTGKSLNDIVNRVLGPAGTQVKITIHRPSTGETLTFTITRAKIVVQNVTWQMLPGTQIAHVRIASFSQNVAKDLTNALTQAKQQGAQGIILDLRNNPGGYLNEAVDVVSQFLATGNVMEEKDAQGKIQTIPVKPGGVATDIPMVVLINEGTASAAEITAGAIQDYNRAPLIGATTFGTGTVLQNFTLSDGSALLLATQEWLTPNGRVIWHKGIVPDIEIKMDPSVTASIPETERDLTAQQLKNLNDTQLLKAIEVLQQKISQ